MALRKLQLKASLTCIVHSELHLCTSQLTRLLACGLFQRALESSCLRRKFDCIGSLISKWEPLVVFRVFCSVKQLFKALASVSLRLRETCWGPWLELLGPI